MYFEEFETKADLLIVSNYAGDGRKIHQN